MPSRLRHRRLHPLLFLLLLILLISFSSSKKPKDLYSTLGLSRHPRPTQRDIKRAYHKLALKYHPDVVDSALDKDLSTRKWIEITKAYEVLGNEQEREFYDRWDVTRDDRQKQQQQGQRGGGGGSGSFFGSPFGGGSPFGFGFGGQSGTETTTTDQSESSQFVKENYVSLSSSSPIIDNFLNPYAFSTSMLFSSSGTGTGTVPVFPSNIGQISILCILEIPISSSPREIFQKENPMEEQFELLRFGGATIRVSRGRRRRNQFTDWDSEERFWARWKRIGEGAKKRIGCSHIGTIRIRNHIKSSSGRVRVIGRVSDSSLGASGSRVTVFDVQVAVDLDPLDTKSKSSKKKRVKHVVDEIQIEVEGKLWGSKETRKSLVENVEDESGDVAGLEEDDLHDHDFDNHRIEVVVVQRFPRVSYAEAFLSIDLERYLKIRHAPVSPKNVSRFVTEKNEPAFDIDDVPLVVLLSPLWAERENHELLVKEVIGKNLANGLSLIRAVRKIAERQMVVIERRPSDGPEFLAKMCSRVTCLLGWFADSMKDAEKLVEGVVMDKFEATRKWENDNPDWDNDVEQSSSHRIRFIKMGSLPQTISAEASLCLEAQGTVTPNEEFALVKLRPNLNGCELFVGSPTENAFERFLRRSRFQERAFEEWSFAQLPLFIQIRAYFWSHTIGVIVTLLLLVASSKWLVSLVVKQPCLLLTIVVVAWVAYVILANVLSLYVWLFKVLTMPAAF